MSAAWQKAKGWIYTASGAKVDLMAPAPEMFCLADIARGLSRTCRYGGHTNSFYSVAEHSVHLANWARSISMSLDAQRAALFHDAAEAFVGDFPAPIKEALPGLERMEEEVHSAIRKRFGVYPIGKFPALLTADRLIRYDEVAVLFDPGLIELGDERLGVPIWGLNPRAAEVSFLREAEKLGITDPREGDYTPLD